MPGCPIHPPFLHTKAAGDACLTCIPVQNEPLSMPTCSLSVPCAVPSPALQKAVKHLLDHRATQFLPVFPARPVRPMRCT